MVVAYDGSVGVSPDGWLPDRVTIEALTRTFTPQLVDRAIAATEAHEERRLLLSRATLKIHF